MSLAKPKNVEEKILSKLIYGTKTTSSLLEELRMSSSLSKQGYYKALRVLRNEESVVIYKKSVSLDPIWIRSNLKVLTTASDKYFIANENQSVILPEDGEEVAYTFSNIKNLDTFWGHIQSTLIRLTPKSEPVFSYDPHYWFYFARIERENELLKEMVELKRQFLMTVGDKTALDKEIKKHFNNDYLQYNYNKLFDNNYFYTTLIGNYIIEVKLDKQISDKIDEIFRISTEVNDDTIDKLQELLDLKSKNRIKISKNKLKAGKLKRKFSKNFYILK